MEENLTLEDGTVIPASELSFTASRAGGPGGQHVNKTSSRVTLEWNVVETSVLDDDKKKKVLARLASRINSEGVIKVHVDTERSQRSNLEIARERLASLISAALKERKKRRATAVPKAQKERRLSQKKRRGEKKRLRTTVESE